MNADNLISISEYNKEDFPNQVLTQSSKSQGSKNHHVKLPFAGALHAAFVYSTITPQIDINRDYLNQTIIIEQRINNQVSFKVAYQLASANLRQYKANWKNYMKKEAEYLIITDSSDDI